MFVEGPEQSFWHCFEDVTNWWRWGGGGGFEWDFRFGQKKIGGFGQKLGWELGFGSPS